jgi:hypothetical protein
MSLTPIPFAFIQQRVTLAWDEALWGYEHQLVGWSGVVALAQHRLCSHSTLSEIELSGLDKSQTSRIGELLRELAGDANQEHEATALKKWLYLVLAWTLDQKARLTDPLAQVEAIYADFDYPIEIENFVRYMPVTYNYDPMQHSSEENENRLFDHWKNYLTAASLEFGGV